MAKAPTKGALSVLRPLDDAQQGRHDPNGFYEMLFMGDEAMETPYCDGLVLQYGTKTRNPSKSKTRNDKSRVLDIPPVLCRF